MHFAFSDDQLELRDGVSAALADLCPPSVVRSAWEAEPRGLWLALSELGLLSMAAPEPIGLGLGAVDQVLVMEACGRAAVVGPLVESVSLLPALVESAPDLAERVAAGEARVALADGQGYADGADRAEAVFRVSGGALTRVVAPRLVAQPALDGTRRLFAVHGVETSVGEGSGVRRRVTLGTSAFLLGLAETVLASAVGYAKDRNQFGKAIGSFQAVQHQLVNAALKLRFAHPMVHRAAFSLDEDHAQRDLHVAMAKLYASEAATFACRVALQVHGAIGYTEELDLHLWMKRIWALSAAWGDPAHQRDRIAHHLSLETPRA